MMLLLSCSGSANQGQPPGSAAQNAVSIKPSAASNSPSDVEVEEMQPPTYGPAVNAAVVDFGTFAPDASEAEWLQTSRGLFIQQGGSFWRCWQGSASLVLDADGEPFRIGKDQGTTRAASVLDALLVLGRESSESKSVWILRGEIASPLLLASGEQLACEYILGPDSLDCPYFAARCLDNERRSLFKVFLVDQQTAIEVAVPPEANGRLDYLSGTPIYESQGLWVLVDGKWEPLRTPQGAQVRLETNDDRNSVVTSATHVAVQQADRGYAVYSVDGAAATAVDVGPVKVRKLIQMGSTTVLEVKDKANLGEVSESMG